MSNKALTAIMAFLAVAAGVYWLFTTRIQSGNLDLTVVPNDAVVTVDGGDRKKAGRISLRPGSHSLRIARSGFDTKTIRITVRAGEEVSRRVLLNANSDEGRQWLKDHPNQVRIGEGIRGEQIREEANRIQEEYPLIAKLPQVNRSWKIGYGQSQKFPNDPEKIAIFITTSLDQYREDALAWIRRQGFNPEDYEIIYKDL